MENIFQIVLGTFAGVIPMTLFSYLMAFLVEEQFKEPVLLSKLISRISFTNELFSYLAGWFIHFTIGFVFVIAYHFLWEFTPISPTIVNGAVIGFGSGIIGITGWAFIFKIHPNPPSVDLNKHYIQLTVAHIIFGIGATIGYSLPFKELTVY